MVCPKIVKTLSQVRDQIFNNDFYYKIRVPARFAYRLYKIIAGKIANKNQSELTSNDRKKDNKAKDLLQCKVQTAAITF